MTQQPWVTTHNPVHENADLGETQPRTSQGQRPLPAPPAPARYPLRVSDDRRRLRNRSDRRMRADFADVGDFDSVEPVLNAKRAECPFRVVGPRGQISHGSNLLRR